MTSETRDVTEGERRLQLSHAELDDLELLLGGAYAPLTALPGEREAAAVARDARLPDGTLWPLPLVPMLAGPSGATPEYSAEPVVLEDLEGTPVVRVDGQSPGGYLAGEVTLLRPLEHGPFRRHRVTARDMRERLRSAGRPVLAALLDSPPNAETTATLRGAHAAGATVLLMALTGAGTPRGSSAADVVRAALDLPAALGVAQDDPSVRVVVVPLPDHDLDPEHEACLRVGVAAAYGATHVLVPADEAAGEAVVALAGDRGVGVVPVGGTRGADPVAGPRSSARRGVTVLFSGLSGSGKSTLAKAVSDALVERSDRTVTLLDGDVVRTHLSKGLGFSREDRDLNVRRIGYVASEITRHAGVALCAPIAPYAATRADVRRMVSEVGEFVLVWVSTPIEVCEQRDRKGLYAKARAGELTGFTGIDDPYEEPDDADLVIDTSVVPLEQGVDEVLTHLHRRGLLGPAPDRED